MKESVKKGLFLIYYLSADLAYASFEESVGGVNNILYGISAGIAVLIITLHLVRWKTAENPTDREEAKKGIFNVILGIIVIIVAAIVVSLLFKKR